MPSFIGAFLTDAFRSLIQLHKHSLSKQWTFFPTNFEKINASQTEYGSAVFHQAEEQGADISEKQRRDCLEPLWRRCEVLEEVTASKLSCVLASTLRAHSAEQTQQLIIPANHKAPFKMSLTVTNVKSLGKACPSIKQLVIKSVDLRSSGRNGPVRLEHFPATLTMLSIRDSLVDTGAFLRTRHSSFFMNIRVLDLGKTIDARGGYFVWPRMQCLEELYLEGSKELDSKHFLQNVFVNCPALRRIDLEGTDVGLDVLVIMALYANYLEEVFLGFTNVRDSSIFALNECNKPLRWLETLCLANTLVAQAGVSHLRQSAPRLRDVTVDRNVVLEDFEDEVIFLPLRVHRLHNVHIGAVFPDQGCDHFMRIYSERRILPPRS